MSRSEVLDISSFLAADTRIRFRSLTSGNDTIFFDNVQIEYSDVLAPGGVDTALNLWLRADAGVSLASGRVSQWDNQVTASPLTDVSASGSRRPTYGASTLNFNPVISFDGTNDKLSAASVLGSTLFSDNSASIYTVASLNDSGDVILQWRDDTGPGNNNRVTIEDQLRFDYGHLINDQYTTGAPTDGYHILNAIASPTTSPVSLSFSIDGQQTTPGSASGDNPLNVGNTGDFTIGDYYLGGYAEDMDLGEVIIFGSDPDAAEQARVDSYLALKYGITLDQAVATNFVDSRGDIVWDATSNVTYNNDIAGIGRDLGSALDQTQSRSMNSDAIVTVSSASDQQNLEFLIWGNDDGELTETATDNPFGVAKRLKRIWRADESGDVGSTTITFDVSGLPVSGSTTSDFKLIIDGDTDFSSGSTLVGASGFAGGIVTFTSVNLADAQFFTLGTEQAVGSPVGSISDVNAGADIALENAASGSTVGITALATDPDGVDTVTYSLDDDAGGLFDVDLNFGVVTLAGSLDYEAATSHDIVVRATSTDASSTTQSFTISVINVNEGLTGAAGITGTPTEDQVLTAGNTLADPDGMGTVGYQWQRNGSDVTGETGTTYTLTDADVGQTIRVVASYTDGGGFSESATSNSVGPIGGINDQPTATIVPIAFGVDEDDPFTALPGLSIADIDDDGFDLDVTLSVTDGILRLGTTAGLTFSSGANASAAMTVTGTKGAINAALATVSYRPDANFNGTDTLTLNVDDRGNTGSGGPQTDNDTASIFVDPVNDPPVGVPTVSGTAQEGFVLTANTGGISDDDGLGAFSYQWLRNGGAITGASNSTYSLVAADVGTNISVRVDYTDGQATAESVTSEQTSPISSAANNLPVGVPVIVGTTTEDQVLAAMTGGISDADGLGTFGYQWLRDAAAIGGATSSTYTLGDADVGTSISLRVSYTDGGGASESVTSAQTPPIADVNDAPTISMIADQVIAEDTSTGPLAFAVADVETPAGLLTVTASSSDTVRIRNSSIVLTDLGGGNWTIEVAGARDQHGGPITVTVIVDDGTNTATETFNVVIDPVNDAPQLDSVPVQSVRDSAAVGTSVVTVSATDSDAGDNQAFAIIGGNPNGDFAITANGTIWVNHPLDHATTSVYHLVVQVADSGSPSLTDTTTVTIAVAAPVTPRPAAVAAEDPREHETEVEPAEPPEPVLDSPSAPAAQPAAVAPHAESAPVAEEMPPLVAVETPVAGVRQTAATEYVIRTSLDDVPKASGLRSGLTASSRNRVPIASVPQPAYAHQELARDLQVMREQVEAPAHVQFYSAATAVGTTGSLTVGYVLWALRGGWLASSVLAQMPAWRLMDPLVVLSTPDGTAGAEEDDSLQAMLKKGVGAGAESDATETES